MEFQVNTFVAVGSNSDEARMQTEAARVHAAMTMPLLFGACVPRCGSSRVRSPLLSMSTGPRKAATQSRRTGPNHERVECARSLFGPSFAQSIVAPKSGPILVQ